MSLGRFSPFVRVITSRAYHKHTVARPQIAGGRLNSLPYSPYSLVVSPVFDLLSLAAGRG